MAVKGRMSQGPVKGALLAADGKAKDPIWSAVLLEGIGEYQVGDRVEIDRRHFIREPLQVAVPVKTKKRPKGPLAPISQQELKEWLDLSLSQVVMAMGHYRGFTKTKQRDAIKGGGVSEYRVVPDVACVHAEECLNSLLSRIKELKGSISP